MAGGGGGPAWPVGIPRELPPRQRNCEALLNRYEFHTRNCPDCRGVRSIRKVATSAASLHPESAQQLPKRASNLYYNSRGHRESMQGWTRDEPHH